MATSATPLSQYWPILCKGQANRLVFPGPPTIESNWHKAMEEGRKLESSINDAMFALQKEKHDLDRAIEQYLDLNQVAKDAQRGDHGRRIFLTLDVLRFLQKIHAFMQDIQGIASAIQSNIAFLQSIESQAVAMIQSNLNALANFMQQICNLGLPPLPSLPAYFGFNIFNFNGFNFAAAGLLPVNISVAAFTNFSFAQCALVAPFLGAYGTPPTVIPLDGLTVGAVSGNFIPPLNGAVASTEQVATSPNLIANITDHPVYTPSVNPATVLVGSLPDPSQIISDFQMPTGTYQSNIVSVIPALLPALTAPDELRKLLVQNVNLDAIVQSNFDKNLTACWLFYLQSARNGRAGEWIPNFQNAYQQFLVPSLELLTAPNAVIPWNNVIGGTSTTAAPSDVPLVDVLVNASPTLRENILWKLSYIEAALLGYSRSRLYDSGADSIYLSSFTGADLDYVALQVNLTDTQTVTLGQGTAQFPVQCTFPKTMANVLNAVIQIAAANIAATPNYQTNKTQFRFTFDAFATATVVDRFTQFWRTFNFNLQQFLGQDPFVVDFIANYVGSLDSAIDPLGLPDDATQIENDSLLRNRSWVPGTPLLSVPVVPQTTIGTLPGLATPTTGWTVAGFDPSSFLGRPDIQSLPLSTQLAMLRTNESYASLLTTQSQIQTAILDAQNQANVALASIQNNGFQVTSTAVLPVKNSAPPIPVAFQQVDFNRTNYVTSVLTYTIQVAGTYMVASQINWDKGVAGQRTVILMQNSNIVLDEQQTAFETVGPTVQGVSAIQAMNVGDTIQVLVSQIIGEDTQLAKGSTLICLLVPTTDVNPLPLVNDADTLGSDPDSAPRLLNANTQIFAGTAVELQPNGGVAPIDPVGALTAPLVDGLVIAQVAINQEAQVGTNYGSIYEVVGANFTPGGLVYAGPGGILTQNYNLLITEVEWIVVVGRAVSSNLVLYTPQLPTQLIGP